MEILEQAEEQSRRARFSLPKEHRGNRMRQFRLDFYNENHYCKGGEYEALQFWRSHQSQFEAYVAVRIKARLARKAAANARRREKKRGEQAVAAAAKVFRHERAVARGASAAALAHSSKVAKAALTPVLGSFDFSRSDAAHAALQEERRIRHKAKRAASKILKQARSAAAWVEEHAVQVCGRFVAPRVDSGEVVSGRVEFQMPAPFCVVHPHRLGRFKAMKSESMPRRKSSARKSGESCTDR